MSEPWSYELSFVAAVDDSEDAERLLDELIAMSISLAPVIFCESGAAHRMKDSDVVPDSPLAEALA